MVDPSEATIETIIIFVILISVFIGMWMAVSAMG